MLRLHDKVCSCWFTESIGLVKSETCFIVFNKISRNRVTYLYGIVRRYLARFVLKRFKTVIGYLIIFYQIMDLIQNDIVTFWPSLDQAGLREELFTFLSSKFEFDKIYSELEVNAILKKHHSFSDHVLLRRELFERGFLGRNTDGTRYCRKK